MEMDNTPRRETRNAGVNGQIKKGAREKVAEKEGIRCDGGAEPRITVAVRKDGCIKGLMRMQRMPGRKGHCVCMHVRTSVHIWWLCGKD